jgi:transaldolase/fructose-6-phosphate aldolase-like protein
MTDPLAELSDRGVSIWLDDLSRPRLTSGRLAELVAHDHVVGVTTNPTIFAKAIARAGRRSPLRAGSRRPWPRPGSRRRSRMPRSFPIAFWLGGGRVLAGMNVNIWDVNEAIQAIVRGGRTVDTGRLADPDVPLEEFAG